MNLKRRLEMLESLSMFSYEEQCQLRRGLGLDRPIPDGVTMAELQDKFVESIAKRDPAHFRDWLAERRKVVQ